MGVPRMVTDEMITEFNWLRENIQMTYQAIADKYGISQTTVYFYADQKPKILTAENKIKMIHEYDEGSKVADIAKFWKVSRKSVYATLRNAYKIVNR